MSLSRTFAVRLALGLITALIVVGWPVARHYRLKWKLEKYKSELKAKGEKLTVAESAPIFQVEASRATHNLISAMARLRPPSPYESNYPPVMKRLGPGHALLTWEQMILPTSETSNAWPSLAASLNENQEVLEDIREILQTPALTFDLDYRQGFNLLLPHLAQLRAASRWLLAAAIFELHEGRVTNACENLMALAHLVNWNRQEPLMISELVRASISQMALSGTWEALQSSQLSDAQLKELQTAWQPVEFLRQAESALAMERAFMEYAFAQARRSYSVAQGNFPAGPGSAGLSELAQLGKEVLDDPKEGLKVLAHRYPAYWAWTCWGAYEDELAHLKIGQAALESVRAARGRRAIQPALKQFEKEADRIIQEFPAGGSWLGSPFSFKDTHRRFITRLNDAEMQCSLLVTAIALKRHQLKRGAYPANLAELVPEFLQELPWDPIDGETLRYHFQPDGSFLLYSVGEDGQDNGGDAGSASDSTPNKPWWKARDAVWPWPATSEETKADFEKMDDERRAVEASRTAMPAMNEAFLRRYNFLPPSSPQTNAGSNPLK